ncbi:hypothetical protein DRH27_03525 [Candidatus Falkowbacteria bacterium]|nr:MAG: hypothetical protein DRH27_03525 [Candidatus Falkowbacteria bacterium]
MNTLLFTLEYPPFKGGVANYYGNLVKNWPEPANIHVLNNENNKLIRRHIRPKWLLAIFVLWLDIYRKKINHILVGQVLPLGIVAYLVSKFTPVTYSLFFHGMDFNYALKTKRKKWITEKIIKKSSHIICASSYTAKLVKNFINSEMPEKIVVVNPGIDPVALQALSLAEPKNKIEELRLKHHLENKFILFTVGRLVKRKGQDMVIKAVNILNEKMPDLCYYIAGDGPDKDYLKDLAKNNSNIVFLGKITEEEKSAWLRVCGIFIMPSREIEGDFEGFGIVFLEAALAGKPVLAGRSGGIEDAVIDYETGILTDPGSVDDIAGGIVELKNSPMLRMELGENAIRRTVNEFSWNKQIIKIFSIITK